MVVARAFNPRTREVEVGESEFEANLVSRDSSSVARATQRKPASRRRKEEERKEKQKNNFGSYFSNT